VGQLEFLKMTDNNNNIAYFPDGRPCPVVLTQDEAIKFLRLDTVGVKQPGKTLERYQDEGLLKGTYISKKCFYSVSELCRFVEKVTRYNRKKGRCSNDKENRDI